jgi:hypothetical protein
MNELVSESQNSSSAIKAGWTCLVLALILILIPFPLFYLYMPISSVAFILAIIGMAKGFVGKGIVLLISSIILPAIFFFIGLGILGQTLNSQTNKVVRPTTQVVSQSASKISHDDSIPSKFITVFNTSYLSKSGEKAIALAMDDDHAHGAWGFSTNQSSQDRASERALSTCQENVAKYKVKNDCRLYAVGNLLVWEIMGSPISRLRSSGTKQP